MKTPKKKTAENFIKDIRRNESQKLKLTTNKKNIYL
jgi:hypothetical protein